MARTDVQDRVTLVNGVADTLSKVVPNAATSSELVLDAGQFELGSVVKISSQMSYDGGRSWLGSGGCSVQISDPTKDPQNRDGDGMIRFFSGSNSMRGRVGIMTRVSFVASIDELPVSRAFDLVSGFDDDKLKAASQSQVEAKGLK